MRLISDCHIATLLLVLLSFSPAVARDDTSNMSTEERLQRLERLVESQGLVDILMRLDNLQQEIQRLRGQSEVQQHTLEELKKRQRELYIDIDRRLLQLERGGSMSATDESMKSPSSSTSTTGKPTVTPQVPDVTRQEQAPEIPPSARASEQQAYQQAFDLLRELQYDKATAAFRRFLENYPDGRYAHIALYWLGEASYAQRKFEQAIRDYEQLINSYPNSPKVAEAMLKIGYSYNELKDYKAARNILEKLMADFPGTTEAGQARNLMQKIRAKMSKN